jgi:hypothetical protein
MKSGCVSPVLITLVGDAFTKAGLLKLRAPPLVSAKSQMDGHS